MKASRLSFDNLFDINARTGIITAKGKRMALMSVEALGLLRRDLINTLGIDRAKNFIMRYGWACGYKDGEILESSKDWFSQLEMYMAGPAMHTLEGLVTVEIDNVTFEQNTEPFLSGIWRNSFESEEHLKHYGIANEPVCWMLVGYANGFSARLLSKERIVFYEKTCVAKGDPYCSFESKIIENSDLEFIETIDLFKKPSLKSELERIHLEVSQLNKDILEVEENQKRLNQFIIEDKSSLDIIQFMSNTIKRSIVLVKKDTTSISSFQTSEDELIIEDWIKAGKPSNAVFNKNFLNAFEIKGSTYHGTLIVIGENKIERKGMLLIERFLGTLSVMLNFEEKNLYAIINKRRDYFDRLFAGTVDKEEYFRNSHEYHLNPKECHYIISLNINQKNKTNDVLFYLLSKNPQWKLFMKNENIIIILSLKEIGQVYNFLKLLSDELIEHFPSINIYVGLGRLAETVEQFGKSYLDAFSISMYLEKLYPKANKIATFKEVEPLILFINSSNQEELIDFYKRTIGMLVEYDQSNQSNFVETLKIYLENNGNLQRTANELHISITGLRYRIERIEAICEVDLKTGEGRFQAQLALRVYYSIKVINEMQSSTEKTQ